MTTYYRKRRYPSPVHRKKGVMNKTETAWAWQLEAQKRTGDIVDYRFEPFKIMIAEKSLVCTYTPDFLVVCEDHFEMHEIKGGGPVRDDAIVKFKMACGQFPWFRWKMIQFKNGQWKTIREFPKD